MMTILTEVRLKRGTEGDWDAVVVATFERPESLVAKLTALGVAPEKILTLRPVERRVGDGRLA